MNQDKCIERAKELAREAHEERGAIIVVQACALDMTQPLRPHLDAFVSRLGYKGLGERWRVVEHERVDPALFWLLTHDQAYECDMMEDEPARVLCDRFLELFSHEVQWFSNSTVLANEANGSRGWNSLVGGTFESGVVGTDGQIIGMMWFDDED